MTLFNRYVVGEVLKYFLIALLGFTLLVTVGMGVNEGRKEGLPANVIAGLIPWMLPEILGITIPVAVLFAVTSVFHRMAAANELLALKSLGISPMRILGPVFLTAAGLSLVTVCMYEVAATWCRPSARQFIYNSLEDIVYGLLRTNGSYSSNHLSVSVRGVQDHTLLSPTITIAGQNGQPSTTLRADRAEIQTDREDNQLVITAYNGQLIVDGKMEFTFPDEVTRDLPLEKVQPRVHRDWLGCGEIPQHIARMQRELQVAETRLHAGGEAKAAGDVAFLRREIARLQTEPYRRWANGFSCLCFALVGAPVAMIFYRGDALGAFFLCFLPILILYYPLLMISEDLSTSGTLPPVAFWLANAAILLPGLWLLRRSLRH